MGTGTYIKYQREWVRGYQSPPLSSSPHCIIILYCIQLKKFINSIIIRKTKPKKKKEIWVPTNRLIRGLKSPWPWCRVVFKLTNMKWTRLMRRTEEDLMIIYRSQYQELILHSFLVLSLYIWQQKIEKKQIIFLSFN